MILQLLHICKDRSKWFGNCTSKELYFTDRSSSQTHRLDQFSLSPVDSLCRLDHFYAHTGLDTPGVLEAEALSVFYYSFSLWLLDKMLPWAWLLKSAGRKKEKRSLAPLLPRLYSCQSSNFCRWEYSQKLPQPHSHLPYLIPTSLCAFILMIGWM